VRPSLNYRYLNPGERLKVVSDSDTTLSENDRMTQDSGKMTHDSVRMTQDGIREPSHVPHTSLIPISSLSASSRTATRLLVSLCARSTHWSFLTRPRSSPLYILISIPPRDSDLDLTS